MIHLSMAVALPVVAATSSDSNWSAIGYLFFLSGFIFFGLMFLRYRNADKRYKHESNTQTEMNNLRVRDDFVRSQTGLKNSRMRGANNRQVSGSLNAMSQISGLAGGNVQGIIDQVNKFRTDR